MTAEATRSRDSRLLGEDQTSTKNTALRGASLAFGKPPVKPKPQVGNYSGNNAALAAASNVGTISRPRSRSTSTSSRLEVQTDAQRPTYQRSGERNGIGSYTGAGERSIVQQRLAQLDHGGNGSLRPPVKGSNHAKSPSLIAATLAASRSNPASPNHTGQQKLSPAAMRRQSSYTRLTPASARSLSPFREDTNEVLDLTPLAPTTSLIGMFEQNAATFEALREPGMKISANTIAANRPPKAQQLPPVVRARTPSPPVVTRQKPDITAPKPLLAQPIPISPRQFNPPKRMLAAEKPSITQAKPIPIPYRSRPVNNEEDKDEPSSTESSSYKPSFRAALQNRRLTSNSSVSLNSNAVVDSLANAIVASSLASSRAASPSRSIQSASLHPPPPLPTRRSPRSHLFHNNHENSRTPSPAKQGGLRTTMRKPKAEVEVDEGEKRRGRKSIMKKHPHKHHEGDRKRWRDEVTLRERKRYEAVWASNKGLFTSSSSLSFNPEASVCNIVVRDVYSRSRLHADVLEEVYALVDRQQNQALEKEEFVVGLWLIDQRLKGRKLPIRVSDSVWRSVGILGGIKVKKVSG